MKSPASSFWHAARAAPGTCSARMPIRPCNAAFVEENRPTRVSTEDALIWSDRPRPRQWSAEGVRPAPEKRVDGRLDGLANLVRQVEHDDWIVHLSGIGCRIDRFAELDQPLAG